MAMTRVRTVSAAGFALVLAACASGGASRGPAPEGLLDAERRAREAYAAGRSDEAARLYQVLSGALPEEPEYWFRLANALYRTGHPDEAAMAYAQALGLDPGNARAWHNLGVVRIEQARQALHRAAARGDGEGGEVAAGSLRLARQLGQALAVDRGNDAPAMEAGPGTAE